MVLKGYTPGIAEALGAFVINWSRVEFVVREIIRQLLGLDEEKAHLLTARMGTNELLEQGHALLVFHPDADEVEVVAAWLDRVDKLRIIRNELMHSTWMQWRSGEDSQAGWLAMRVSKKGGVRRVELAGRAVSEADLKAWNLEVVEVFKAQKELPEAFRVESRGWSKNAVAARRHLRHQS